MKQPGREEKQFSASLQAPKRLLKRAIGASPRVVRGRWKMIDNGQTHEVYDIHADPNELSNLATTRPQVYNDLRAMLQQYIKRGSVSPFE